jgi:hypothetical protein
MLPARPWILLSLALATAPAAEAAGGAAGERLDTARVEALALARAASSLWPGWTPGADAAEGGPVATRELERSELVAEALLGGAHDALEARIALEVAALFRLWAEGELPPPPRFEDGSPPAPAPWAAQAERRALQAEARWTVAALRASGEAQLRRAAARIAAARFRRIAAMDAARVAAMRRRELAEGLAAYTAYHALRLGRGAAHEPSPALRGEAPDFAYAMAPRFRDRLLARLRAVASGETGRASPELSGAGLALVLDRLRPGWREELLEGWKPLDGLLATLRRPFGNQ